MLRPLACAQGVRCMCVLGELKQQLLWWTICYTQCTLGLDTGKLAELQGKLQHFRARARIAEFGWATQLGMPGDTGRSLLSPLHIGFAAQAEARQA